MAMERNSSIILHDSLDQLTYQSVIEQAKEFKRVISQGEELYKTLPTLAADIFYSLYKPSPEINPVIPPSLLLNRGYLTKLMESPAYHGLRDYTVLDDLGAALGSKSLLESLLQQMQQESNLKNILQAVKQAETCTEGNSPNAINHNINGANQGETNSDFYDQAEQLCRANSSAIRKAVEVSVNNAVTEAENLESVVVTWGLDKGDFQRLPLNTKIHILHMLKEQKKFREMTKLVGRMRRMAMNCHKAKLPSDSMELHSITTGNQLSHVLPQEFAALRHPVFKKDFYRRYAEKLLLIYDLTTKQTMGQGPIIALVDTSSSMHNGGREEWSKAVALGLAEIASTEQRAFCFALFGSKRSDLITGMAPHGRLHTDDLLTLVQGFTGGGTDFEKPLSWAMQKLTESNFQKADIVMITDGECAVSTEFYEQLQSSKNQKGFSIFSILIGNTARELKRWSDSVWEICSLVDDSPIQEIYESISKR